MDFPAPRSAEDGSDLFPVWFYLRCFHLKPGFLLLLWFTSELRPRGVDPEPPVGSEERNNGKFRSDVQLVLLTAEWLFESGALRKMNKDPRLARKGASINFGPGRRHSCLGYVPELHLLFIFSHMNVQITLLKTATGRTQDYKVSIFPDYFIAKLGLQDVGKNWHCEFSNPNMYIAKNQ